MKPGKAPEPDYISVDFLKSAFRTIMKQLTRRYNRYMDAQEVPDQWKTSSAASTSTERIYLTYDSQTILSFSFKTQQSYSGWWWNNDGKAIGLTMSRSTTEVIRNQWADASLIDIEACASRIRDYVYLWSTHFTWRNNFEFIDDGKKLGTQKMRTNPGNGRKTEAAQLGIHDAVIHAWNARKRWAAHVVRRADDRWTTHITLWYPREERAKAGPLCNRWERLWKGNSKKLQPNIGSKSLKITNNGGKRVLVAEENRLKTSVQVSENLLVDKRRDTFALEWLRKGKENLWLI
ncbi:hypothetical protein COOONC_04551 [Cooperia oncophora]